MTERTGSVGMSRRHFLRKITFGAAATTAAASATGWIPAAVTPPGEAALPVPPQFPPGIGLFQHRYANWSKEIAFDGNRTYAPRDEREVSDLANWAAGHGYTLRAHGSMHGWSPLTVVPGRRVDTVILIDTTKHLVDVSVDPTASRAILTAQGGARLLAILTDLEVNRLGWASIPAIGDITIGGARAIDVHGETAQAEGIDTPAGIRVGSASNLVTEMTATVWDSPASAYVARTFARSDPGIRPKLTHLGRTLIISVTLQAGGDRQIRCQRIHGTVDAQALLGVARNHAARILERVGLHRSRTTYRCPLLDQESPMPLRRMALPSRGIRRPDPHGVLRNPFPNEMMP